MAGEIEADEEWRKVTKENVPFMSRGGYGQRGPMEVSEELMDVYTKESTYVWSRKREARILFYHPPNKGHSIHSLIFSSHYL